MAEKFIFSEPPKFVFSTDESKAEGMSTLDKFGVAAGNLLSGGLNAAEQSVQGIARSSAKLQEDVNPIKAKVLNSLADMSEGVADKVYTPPELPKDASVGEEILLRDIPQAVGQAGFNLVASYVSRPLSLIALFGQGYESLREDAERAGADEDTQAAAGFSGGAVETLTETIGLEAIRAKLPLTGWKGVVAKIGFGAAVNSVQEAAAGMLNDLQAKYGLEYDPDRDVWKERGHDAAIGGAVGGILSALTTLAGLKGKRGRVKEESEEVSEEDDARQFFEEATEDSDILEGEVLTPEKVEEELAKLERFGEIIDGEILRDRLTGPEFVFEDRAGAALENPDLGVSDDGANRVVPVPLLNAPKPPVMPEYDTIADTIIPHTIDTPDTFLALPAPENFTDQVELEQQEILDNIAEQEVEDTVAEDVSIPLVDGLTEGESRVYHRLMDKMDLGTITDAEVERFTELQEKSAGVVEEIMRRAQTAEELNELREIEKEVRESEGFIEGSESRGNVARGSAPRAMLGSEMEAVINETRSELPQLPEVRIFNNSTPMPDVAKSIAKRARAFFIPAQPSHPQPVIYLKEGAFSSPESVQRTLVHEGVVHHGLRALVYGKGETADAFKVEEQVAALMEPFYQTFKDEIQERVIGQLGYQFNLRNPAERARAAEEWLADMAERKNYDRKFKAVWNKFVTRVMRWLRTNPVTKNWRWVKKVKRAEVEAILEELHKRTAQPNVKMTDESYESRVKEVKVVNKPKDLNDIAKRHPLVKFPNKAVLTELNNETVMPVESAFSAKRQVVFPKGNYDRPLGEILFLDEGRDKVVDVRAEDERVFPILAAQLHRQALLENRAGLELLDSVNEKFRGVVNELYPNLPELDAGRSPFIPPLEQKGEEERTDLALKEYGIEEINVAMQRYRHDRMKFVLRYLGNLSQVVRENGHVPGVLEYWNTAQQIPAYVRKHAKIAEDNIKRLRELSAKEQENLWDFMMYQEYFYDYSKERYGFPQWIIPHSGLEDVISKASDKVREKVIKKFNLDEKLLDTYDNIASSMHMIVKELEEIQLAEISRTIGHDPVKLAEAERRIKKKFSEMRKRPYLPRIRFGRYVLKAYHTKDVKDSKGRVLHEKGSIHLAAAFESKAERALIAKKLQSQGFKTDETLRLDGMDFQVGMLNTEFLNLLKDHLNLTQEQRAQMAELMEQYSPTVGFAKHLKHRKGIAGWSNDFRRAYASYMMTASHALAKIKYKPELVRATTKITQSTYTLFDEHGQPIGRMSQLPVNTNTDTRKLIAQWFREHQEDILSFDKEFTTLNTLAYINYLWAVPKAAVVNLTQTPMMTYPYLASRYGKAAAFKELISNLKYLQMWSREEMKWGKAPAYVKRAVEAARNIGLFDETLMRQLGNAANGYEITKAIENTGQLKDRGKELFQQLLWYGGALFNGAEKANRLLAFITGYTLEHKKRAQEAGANPNDWLAPQLAAINRMPEDLLIEPQVERTAPFVAGRLTVQQTQFIFGKINRPKVFRGKLLNWLGAMQTPTFEFLYAIGRDRAKWMIMAMLAAFAGLEGLPFVGTAMSGFDIIATRVIEATADEPTNLPVNSKYEVRKYLRELFDDTIVNPGILYGGMLGPDGFLNISSSLSLGDPFNIGETMRERALLSSDRTDPSFIASVASSIVVPDMMDSYFSQLTSNRFNSAQDRFMSIAPGLKKPYQAAKWFEEGGVYTKGGLPLVEFGDGPGDVNPYSAEWLSAFAGFNPATISKIYEERREATDAARYWASRREDLIARAKNARSEEAMKIVDKAIAKYNSQLPEGGKGKLYLPKSRVLRAMMIGDIVRDQTGVNIPAWSREKYQP